MSGSNFIRGTLLLTGASFLSKFLGMIYVIPFTNMVGETGMTLYGFAYIPYTILLSISTVGVPLAVSKFVAKYNALGDYYTSMRMFRVGSLIMLATGLIAFVIMYFGSGFLASLSLDQDTQGITIEEVQHVMEMVSFALIIIPSMAIMRGFFQGNQSMGPTAVSQVVEQVVRIAFLLIAVFIVMNMMDGSAYTAIGFATFAAFIGGVASWIVLGVYWRKRRKYIYHSIEQQEKKENIPTKELLKELFRYSGPFVLVGIAIPLYQLIDQFTFSHAMAKIGQAEVSTIAFSAFNVQGHKLVIIPVTIATGLSLALVPAITKSFNEQHWGQVKKQINQSLQIIMFFVLPSVLGLIILADAIYGGLFGIDNLDITGQVFAWYAPMALTFAFFTVTASILQGIEKQKFTLISLAVGVLMKLLVNSILIQQFEAIGAILATLIATLIAVLLNMWQIHKTIDFGYRRFFKLTLLMAIFTTIMSIVILVVKFVLGLFLDVHQSRVDAIIMMIAGVGIGGFVYLYLGYYSTLFEKITGKRIAILDRLMRR
ncbi:putative polysaccharide biosynthesis protein [Gracilibacillus alcaliphilus]|uniref:putative polysaccharide biosynthesis protein n=1 Tax=Gracilibacillus alcaliphilus TaxID=1401441 RepID=UPI001958C7EE|nr:polysaccharide biosynthesis protein [Gracilibacillus alcaliphilus]MBM7679481.1 O-antigen/teichoic acid export membrane protein [Gracilibacillus alcaliphilus]